VTANTENDEARSQPRQIASWWHLGGYMAIIAGLVAWGFHTQRVGLGTAPSPNEILEHREVIKIYMVSMLADWALLYYCWVGVHKFGGTLRDLSGGLWTSWRQLLVDVAIALPFWVIWEATAYGVHWILGPTKARSVDTLLPQSLLEVVVWILLSMTAGFCEELQSRGYLQRQFHALTGSGAAAVLGQGLVFGFMHSYQGWKQVIVISALGVLYGALAAWRRNLRANILAHAWSDVWEGWLKFLVWR
jgi:CAAX protease family protein